MSRSNIPLARIGEMTHRLEIRTSTSTQDGQGEETEVFATQKTVWAEMGSRGVQERQGSGEELRGGAYRWTRRRFYRIWKRSFPGLTIKDRVRANGIEFEIIDLEDDGARGDLWRLTVKEARPV